MNKKLFYIMVAVLLLTESNAVAAPVGEAKPIPVVSANIPLDSYIYDDLRKLDGMGYVQDMRIGMKPYTRMQAAKWLLQAQESGLEKPEYIQKILAKLQQELAAELRYLADGSIDSELGLKEWQFAGTYYSGEALDNYRSTSAYQPLNINNDGYALSDHENLMTGIRVEKSLDKNFVISAKLRYDYAKEDHDVSWQSAYIKGHIRNAEFTVGKDALWWGQGERGTLALSNNAKPLTYVKIANIEPMRFSWWKGLGDIYASVLYAEVSDQHKFDGSILKDPGFVAVRADFVPTDRFTFGIARTSIIDRLNSRDIKDFLLGTNAEDAGVDKWNSIAGIDFRWRLPHQSNAQLYGEVYGEDQSHELGFIPFPSKKAFIFGLYLPKITDDGRFEANIEYGHTTDVWYNHWVFGDGYVNAGNIIGDAMGNNANRYGLRITHYIDDSNQLSLNVERLASNEKPSDERKIDSIWLSGKSRLADDLLLESSVGVSRINLAQDTKRNYACSLMLKRFF